MLKHIARTNKALQVKLSLFVVQLLLILKLLIIVNSCFSILLILGDQIIHVGVSLSELHLIHTLTSVPVKESLSPEHSSELLAHTLEELLDGSAVANEGGAHLETARRNVTDGGLHVVGDPFN